MNDYSFEQIKEMIHKWSQNDISKQLAENDYVEVTKNEEEVLLLDLTFEYCLAQIIVSKPTFAPYQYVSFESMTLESKKTQETGQPEMVYFFYDSVDMLDKEVLEELNFGIKRCSEYIPDQLREIYLGKKGLLNMENEKLHHIVHPDDMKSYDKDLFVGDCVCVDIEAQYLLVKNELSSLRVLPLVFIIR